MSPGPLRHSNSHRKSCDHHDSPSNPRTGTIVGVTNWREEGLTVFRKMLPGVLPDGDVDFGGGFAPELMDIGVEGIFGRLWSREGLSLRDRSLVTLGILIALRAEDELQAHFKIARQNGLTDDELAEVIYHSSGYAGFPAANTAKGVAAKVLKP